MKLSQIPYKRITLEEITKQMKEFIDKFENATSAKEQMEIYKQYDEYGADISTTFSLLNIRFTLDTTDEFYQKEKVLRKKIFIRYSVNYFHFTNFLITKIFH